VSRKTIITWPLLDLAAICALQTTAGAGSLLINGDQAQAVNPNSSTKIFRNFNLSRNVSVTSTGNLSAINFTITGLDQFGRTLTQTIAGPSNSTVDTTVYYASVSSVTVSAAVGTNVSVGTGNTGYTNWQKFNYHATIDALTAAVDVVGTINYTFQATLDDPAVIAVPVAFGAIENMTSQTASSAGSLGLYLLPYGGGSAPDYDVPTYVPTVIDYFSLLINSSDNTGSLTFTAIQQGIT
jgi:hypothetical protein